MKLSVSRETLLARLGVAVRAASTRSAIQTLAGVLLRVEGGRAELQATDMEMGVRVALEAQESTDGQVVVPGRLLLDVVRSLPKDDLTLPGPDYVERVIKTFDSQRESGERFAQWVARADEAA